MKRLVKLLGLLLAFTLIAAACGDSDEDATPATEAPAATDAPDTTEDEMVTNVGLTFDIGGRGDQSFNDSAAAGIDAAQGSLGITYTEAEPNADGSNRPELLQAQADVSELVIAVGFLFGGDVAAVAADNPDVNFAVIDDPMLDFDNGGVPLADNIAGLTFAEHEGSYLVGMIAALKSETGTIGYLAALKNFGVLERFEAGYVAGARSINPDINIIIDYITEFPDFSGFEAPDRAQEISLAMYAQDADIIFQVAGGAGAGMFEAASEYTATSGSKVWGIGVDSDQYNTVDPSVQEFVLSSMLKRVDVAVSEIVAAHEAGSFASGNTVYDLSVDGVGYSTTGGFIDDIVDQLEAAKADIISGAIEVPNTP